MYEDRSQPLLPTARFVRRLGVHLLVAIGIVALSLAIGTLGYHGFGKRTWIDSFLNTAMLLGGMGPVGDLSTNSGKLFAAIFALYSGLVFIVVTTLLISPVLHRIAHRIHLDEDDVNRSETRR